MINHRIVRAAAVSAALLSLSACSFLEDSSQGGYQRADSVKALEVPPDLASPDQGAQFIIPGDTGGKLARNMLLPTLDSTRLVRDGRVAWLEFETAPENLWPLLKRFFAQEGLPLERSEPLNGLLATQWVETRQQPGQQGLARLFSSVFEGVSDSGLRDSFVLRLERSEDSTRLFLRHRGLQEVITSDVKVRENQIETAWGPRPRDADIEARLLHRMLVFFGLDEQRASGILSDAEARKIIDLAYVDQNERGEKFLFVGQTTDLVWLKLEDALDNVGFDIDEVERNAGRISISRYGLISDPEAAKGVFGRLFSTKGELNEYFVYLDTQAAGSRIRLRDPGGEVLPASEEQAILDALQGEFR